MEKMKVLIDIGHPAHVHFFKNFIWGMEDRGHSVSVIVKDKEIATYLLEKYNIPFKLVAKQKYGIANKALGYGARLVNTFKAFREIGPDIGLGIASFPLAQAGAASGVPTIIFDDTEHSRHEIALYKPFATKIATPSCFTTNLGEKQVRYQGFHELAYLHPHYFKKDRSVLEEIGVDSGGKYSVIRFVSWAAGHDVGQSGISLSNARRLVDVLSKHGEVYITSEDKLPRVFEQYRLPVLPEKIHHLLAYASLYVGESPTMTTESALLGTPAVCINSWACSCGNFQELLKYGLIDCFYPSDFEAAADTVISLISDPYVSDNWQLKRDRILEDKIDVTAWMIEFIEDSI